MTKARDMADILGGGFAIPSSSLTNVIGKNLIINGNMAIAQRGTSVTGVDGGGYETVDRFRTAYNGPTDQLRVTHAQVADAPAGLTNSFKLTVTTEEGTLADDERVRLQQRIEAFNLQHLAFGTSSASPITLSFYVKSSMAGTYGVELHIDDASRSAAQSYTISSANTWEKKTLTFAGDTVGAINNDNGEGLRVSWVLAAGDDYTTGTLATAFAATTSANLAPSNQVNLIGTDNATWQLTGVQLEVGDVATPFEHESYAANLQKCQRYFYRIGGKLNANGSYNATVSTGVMYGATSGKSSRSHPVLMRAAPSITFNRALGSTAASYRMITNSTSNYLNSLGQNTSTVENFTQVVLGNVNSTDGAGLEVTTQNFSGATVDVISEL